MIASEEHPTQVDSAAPNEVVSECWGRGLGWVLVAVRRRRAFGFWASVHGPIVDRPPRPMSMRHDHERCRCAMTSRAPGVHRDFSYIKRGLNSHLTHCLCGVVHLTRSTVRRRARGDRQATSVDETCPGDVRSPGDGSVYPMLATLPMLCSKSQCSDQMPFRKNLPLCARNG